MKALRQRAHLHTSILLSSDSEITWWENDGSPFGGEWWSRWQVEPQSYALLLADLDDDGAPETIVARGGSSELVAWKTLLERVHLSLVSKGWRAWPTH